jgi:RHS repeat-associated protein
VLDGARNVLSRTSRGSETFTYTYDALDRLDTETRADGRSFTYRYDPSGLLATLTEGSQVWSWSPDAAGRTLGATDPALGTVGYGYGANGNLPGDGVLTYAYDPEGRLTAVSQGTATLASYGFDPLGRRSSETLDAATTRFLYAGAEVIGEVDDQGALVKRFIPGPGLDEPIAFETQGSRYYYHADSTGSVVALSDAAGDIAERFAYGPYGETGQASSLGNPYRYTARRYDQATGLYHYRNRAYSPALGRFLQPDPAGYADGLNLYAYVGNNPIGFVDPWGLGGNPGQRNLISAWDIAVTAVKSIFHGPDAAIDDTLYNIACARAGNDCPIQPVYPGEAAAIAIGSRGAFSRGAAKSGRVF